MRKTSLLLCSLMLAGCATSNTTMLDEQTAIISVSDQGWGMDLTGKLLQTAARMAHERGFPAFQIIGETADGRSGVVAIPGTTTTNASSACYGTWCSGTSTTTGMPAQMIPYTEVRKNITVRFLRADQVTSDMQGIIKTASVLSSK